MSARRVVIAVSSPERYFADDLSGFCSRCGCVVFFRPHTTTAVALAERICSPCFLKWTPDDGDVVEFVTSEESIREAALYFAKTGRTQ
jgi:hypothetical protein